MILKKKAWLLWAMQIKGILLLNTQVNEKKPSSKMDNGAPWMHLYPFWGQTHVVYATFIVTAMVNERGFGEGTAGTFWAVVGGLSIFSGPLFGWLSDRLGRKMGMMVVYTLFTISYALVAANLPDPFLYASIGILRAGCLDLIPTIMAAAVGDYMGPVQAVKAFGFITLFFGAGQIGRTCFGRLSGRYHGNLQDGLGCVQS